MCFAVGDGVCKLFHLHLFRSAHYYPEFPKCSDKSAILIARFGQFDPINYNVKEIFQFIMMAMEMISLENDYATVAGVSQILDLNNIKYEHLQRFDRSIFQRYFAWLQECCPLRMKEVYVINASKEIQRHINMMSILLKNQKFQTVSRSIGLWGIEILF